MRRPRISRSRRGVGSYLPLFVTIAILLTWHFFRVSIFLSVPARCLQTYEFWLEPYEDAWPLFGSFALAFLLLFAWNAAVWFDRETRTRTDRVLVVLNGLALCCIALVLPRMIDLAQTQYYEDGGGYAAWNRTQPDFWKSNTCEVAKAYLGTWDVVSVEAPFLGQTFPFRWIEFRRDLTFWASTGRFLDPIEGRWSPSERPIWRRWSDPGSPGSVSQMPGWIFDGNELGGVWDFELGEEGSRLTLTTPDRMELPISRVVLQRR